MNITLGSASKPSFFKKFTLLRFALVLMLVLWTITFVDVLTGGTWTALAFGMGALFCTLGYAAEVENSMKHNGGEPIFW